MEKAKTKSTRGVKRAQNVQQVQDMQPFEDVQQMQDMQQFEDMQQMDTQPMNMQQEAFFDAAAMPEISNSPLMPVCAVVPMPYDPFCPQFTLEEALQKGTLFKWLYSPYTPCAPKSRRKCTC